MGPQASSPSPPTPDARPAETVLHALRRLVRFIHLADREAHRRAGVSAAGLFVLGQLAEVPGASLGELAARTLTDPSSVSTVVAPLVARGLVARHADPGDRRRARLVLTDRGRRARAHGRDLAPARVVAAVEALPKSEARLLARSLTSFVRAVGADDLAPRMFFAEESPASRRVRPAPRKAAAPTRGRHSRLSRGSRSGHVST